MKILHTSDWHLGRTLYGRNCYYEFKSFLDWLIGEISTRRIECLLVAGDIFDTTTPSNAIQNLYYSFLHKVTGTCCRHVVIIGGNHDSPSLLDAPRQLLQELHVTVVGAVSDNPHDEVISLCDPEGREEMIVCAVPFLRDRDVRRSSAGETIEEKAENLVQGIADHYNQVVKIANEKRKGLEHIIPLVVMGHLFTAGGKIAANNEVRDLYIGSLAHINSSLFPHDFNYLALGHLHIAQKVDHSEFMRYSGSPLQLSFGRENSQKSVTVLEIVRDDTIIDLIPVPAFLRLESISGDYDQIMQQIEALSAEDQSILMEIIYTGIDIFRFVEAAGERLAGSKIELLRTVNKQQYDQISSQQFPEETLEDLDEKEVFRRCLDAHRIDQENRAELEHCFAEILASLTEDPLEESGT